MSNNTKKLSDCLSKHQNDLIDYILSHENEDFFSNLLEMGLDINEVNLLNEWAADEIGTTQAVKDIFKKLSGKHIYATAICLQYKIEE